MLGKFEITSAAVLEDVHDESELSTRTEVKQVMIQVVYEERNNQTFLSGQLVIEVPTAIANTIELNRPIRNSQALKAVQLCAIEKITNSLDLDVVNLSSTV